MLHRGYYPHPSALPRQTALNIKDAALALLFCHVEDIGPHSSAPPHQTASKVEDSAPPLCHGRWDQASRSTTHPPSHHPRVLNHHQCSWCALTTTPQPPATWPTNHSRLPTYLPCRLLPMQLTPPCPTHLLNHRRRGWCSPIITTSILPMRLM